MLLIWGSTSSSAGNVGKDALGRSAIARGAFGAGGGGWPFPGRCRRADSGMNGEGERSRSAGGDDGRRGSSQELQYSAELNWLDFIKLRTGSSS